MTNDNNRREQHGDDREAGEELTEPGAQGDEAISPEDAEPEWTPGHEEGLPGEYIKHEKGADDAAQQSLPTNTGRRVRIGFIVLLVTFVGLGGWAALAPLHGAAVATGKVVVDSENRVVQHLEGGIVSAIHVQEGDRVEKGEVLMQLSQTKPRSELEVVESQLREVLGREARLLAERVEASEVTFPEELTRQDTETVNNIIEGQRALFETRLESTRGRREILEKKIKSLKQQIKGLGSANEMLQKRISSVDAELSNWEELYQEDLADRTRINEMQRRLYQLRGEKLDNESRISEMRVEIGKTRTEMLVNKQDFKEKVAERLRETQQKEADLKARRLSLQDRLDRTTIRAPDNGTVVGMKVFTAGAVLRAGDKVLEIVPSDQEQTIQARVKPQDIDRVSVGQKADVRLSAFNQQANQLIEGELRRISADSFKDEQSGERYFEARVRITGAGRQTMEDQRMFLTPGMPAEVMIRTSARTALQYLVDPVDRMMDRAFREQ